MKEWERLEPPGCLTSFYPAKWRYGIHSRIKRNRLARRNEEIPPYARVNPYLPDLWAVPFAERLQRLTGIPPQSFRVFFNVSPSDLSPSDGDPGQFSACINPITSVVICEGPQIHFVYNLPFQWSFRLRGSVPSLIAKGLHSFWGHYKVFLSAREKGFSAEVSWQRRPRVIPAQYIPLLCRRRLLKKVSTPQVPIAYVPTEYGWQAGLSLGCYMNESGAVFCVPACAAGQLEEVLAPWTPGRFPEERLASLWWTWYAFSPPADPPAEAAVRALADCTLDDYMAGLPSAWKRALLDGLALDGHSTVRQAALAIAPLLLAETHRKEQRHGEKMLLRLCGPFVFARARDWAGEGIPDGVPAARETIPSFFRGLGIITGSGCPEWNAEDLDDRLRVFNGPEDGTYGNMVSNLFTYLSVRSLIRELLEEYLMPKYQGKEYIFRMEHVSTRDLSFEAFGFPQNASYNIAGDEIRDIFWDALRRLLVDPFVMMAECEGEEVT